MARTKRKTFRQRWDGWLSDHPACACAIIGGSVALALTVLYLFVTYSGFGSSADFIYNQF
jgi:hypothetical protein